MYNHLDKPFTRSYKQDTKNIYHFYLKICTRMRRTYGPKNKKVYQILFLQ